MLFFYLILIINSAENYLSTFTEKMGYKLGGIDQIIPNIWIKILSKIWDGSSVESKSSVLAPISLIKKTKNKIRIVLKKMGPPK